MVTLVLIVLYAVVQTGYLGSELLDLFFLTRPTNWVDPTAADSIADDELPRVVLVYPVLDEAEEKSYSLRM